MIAVLMDNRRHKTVQMWSGVGYRWLVPVETTPSFRLAEIDIATVPTYETAEFTWLGDHLRGDPIFMQTSGPELPARWWDR